MNKQEALELLKEEFPNEIINVLHYWAWPQTFSTTAGPFLKNGMFAGQAFTTFPMEAWSDGKHTCVFSKGQLVRCVKSDEPFCSFWYTAQRKHY